MMVSHQEYTPPPGAFADMIHDLVLASVFLAMIIAPAFVAMQADDKYTDAL